MDDDISIDSERMDFIVNFKDDKPVYLGLPGDTEAINKTINAFPKYRITDYPALAKKLAAELVMAGDDATLGYFAERGLLEFLTKRRRKNGQDG